VLSGIEARCVKEILADVERWRANGGGRDRNRGRDAKVRPFPSGRARRVRW
jgi:hypothetical protein